MAYRLELPDRLAGVHNVFHVSHLRKCLHDSAEVVEPSILEEAEVEREATMRRVPTRILGVEVKNLRNRGATPRKTRLGKLRTEDALPTLFFLRVHL